MPLASSFNARVRLPLPPSGAGARAALEVDACLLAALEKEFRELTADGALDSNLNATGAS
jgi:hypothetical protein